MDLNGDVLNLIFSFTQNPKCIIVCKNWYNIIIKKSLKCLNCNKIIKYYNYKKLWITESGNLLCHTEPYYLNIPDDYFKPRLFEQQFYVMSRIFAVFSNKFERRQRLQDLEMLSNIKGYNLFIKLFGIKIDMCCEVRFDILSYINILILLVIIIIAYTYA